MIIFINDQPRGVNEYILEKCLFYAATLLHFNIKDLPSDLTVPAAPETNVNIKTVINVTFDHFSTLCKNFTIAMSLKYQVQGLLFNNDTTPELMLLKKISILRKWNNLGIKCQKSTKTS